MNLGSTETFNQIWRALRITAISCGIIFLFIKAVKADALCHPIDIELSIQFHVQEWMREQREERERAYREKSYYVWIDDDAFDNSDNYESNTIDNRDRD